MPVANINKVKGLQTFSNFISAIPEGSLFEATNVNIDKDGIIEPRRGIYTFSSFPDEIRQIMTFKDHILVNYGNKIAYQTVVETDEFRTFKKKSLFSITSGQNVINTLNHKLDIGDTVFFTDIAGASNITVASGDPATPFYYVIAKTTNTISISATVNGSAITFTTGTTGQGTLVQDFIFNPVSDGLRLKTIEVNGGLYVTTADGIKKIAGLGDYYVSDAGGIAAFECNLTLDLSTNNGFFGPLYSTNTDGSSDLVSSNVDVAYRVTWYTKDINTNLIEGAPSARAVISNTSGSYRNVNIDFTVPSSITTDYYFRVYRTNVAVTNGSGDEMKLVFEAPFSPTATLLVEGYDYDSATNVISVNDSQTEELRNTGTPLYTNENSGEGIAQSNNRPPVAADIALFKNVAFYANTRTAYKQTLSFLGFDNVKKQDVLSFDPPSGGTTKLTFSVAHNLVAGDYIALGGSNIDEQYVVLASPAPTATEIYITNSTTVTTLLGGATVYKSHLDLYKNRATVDEIVRRYFLVGKPEVWSFVAQTKTLTPDADYFRFTSYDDKVKYTFWISKGVNIPINSTTDIVGGSDKVTINSHPFSNGDQIHFRDDSTGLPTQLAFDIDYYVINKTANDFQLSLDNVNPINFDSGGAGIAYVIKNSSAVQPSDGDRVYIKIDLTNLPESATDAQVALEIQSVLIATGDFTVDATGNTLTISTASSGKVTDALSGTMVGTPAVSITKTQDGYGEDATKNFVRLSTYLSPSVSIEDSARSLVNVMNRDNSGLVNAYYTSGPVDLPGQMNFESKSIDSITFDLITTNGTNDDSFGKMFNPDLTTYVSAENDVAANKVYFSKNGQPEAVPLTNSLTVGPKNKAILRIVALKDSLFILKEEAIYRLTGYNTATFNVTIFDNSASISAPDTAAILNNQIYCLTTQGISTISETGVGIISRPIENLINAITAPSFQDFSKIAFGVTYEADRSYLLFVQKKNTDTYATRCYRYNTFTQCWTSWNVTHRCGVVDAAKNKLYLGAADINALEVERKTLTSRDYADRQYNRIMTAISTDGVFVDNAANIAKGDMLVQKQYLTLSHFNRLIGKINADPSGVLTGLQEITAGASLMTSLNSLLAQLQGVDAGFLVISNAVSEDSAMLQTKFNTIVSTLNASTVFETNTYKSSTGSTEVDILVSFVNKGVNEVVPAYKSSYVLGDVIHYKAISSSVIWAPTNFGDPTMGKHIRQGTLMLESNGLFAGTIGYASDLSGNFEDIDFGMDGSGNWGAAVFGDTAWGGEGTSYPLRTLIPRQKQRCRYIKARFKHTVAMFKYLVLGISYTYESTSDRMYR